MTEINHEMTDETICPYCWYENMDSKELLWNWNTLDWKEECPNCDKEYKWYADISVDFTTKK